MWPTLPLEFYVAGMPVSLQNHTPARRDAWKARVAAAGRNSISDDAWAFERIRISIDLLFFPIEDLPGDLDNYLKLVIDGLVPHILLDDDCIDRIWAQRFRPGERLPANLQTDVMLRAVASAEPTVYIRLAEYEEHLRE